MIDETIWCPSLKFHTHKDNISKVLRCVGGGEKKMSIIKYSIGAILAMVFLTGFATASTFATINTGTAPIDADYNIAVPVGADLYGIYGVQAEYSGWTLPGGMYNVTIRLGKNDPSGTVVFGNAISMPIPSAAFNVPLTWAPPDTQLYTIFVNGNYATSVIRGESNVVAPIPELSTAALMSVGLIGLVGMTRYRRKE